MVYISKYDDLLSFTAANHQDLQAQDKLSYHKKWTGMKHIAFFPRNVNCR